MRKLGSMLLVFFATAVLLVPATASANLGDVLGDIQWGDDRDTVLEKLRGHTLAELREDSRLRNDQSAMQAARQQVIRQIERIENSYTELEGERTDYDVSVVSGEFTRNNDESLLRVRDDVAQRFYFFLEDELYKVVVAYDERYIEGVDFNTFVNQTRQQYGEPASTGDSNVAGQTIWRDARYRLEVNDQRDYFGTFTMTFSDRRKVEQLEEQGRTFGGNDQDAEDGGVSARVQAVTSPADAGDDGNEGIVDEMLGGGTDIDLGGDDEEEEKEKKEEEKEEREEVAAGSEPEPQQDESTTTTGSSTTTGSGAADQDDDDDDLVIY